MATVRITDKLIYTIANNAERQFKQRLDLASVPIPITGDEVLDAYFEVCPQQKAAAEAVAAAGWSDYKIKHIRAMRGRSCFDFNLAQARPGNLKWRIVTEGSEAINLIGDHPVFLKLDRLHAERQANIKAVTDAREAFTNQVKAVLAQAPSLNKALVAWPQLERLVPSDVMDRVNEPTQRNIRSKADAEQPAAQTIDLDQLNGTLVSLHLDQFTS
jgi:hypothetical protein